MIWSIHLSNTPTPFPSDPQTPTILMPIPCSSLNQFQQMYQEWQDYSDYDKGQQVIPATQTQGSIWISGYVFADNISKLQENNIFAVCSAANLKFTYPKEFAHIVFDLEDCESQKIGQCFEKAFTFIDEQRKKTNVLVHCAAGISRSSSLLISYLMRKNGWGYEEALKAVKDKRKYVQPNSGFQRQLREFEKEIKK